MRNCDELQYYDEFHWEFITLSSCSVCTFWARGKSIWRVFQVCLCISNLHYHRFLRNRLFQQLVTCGFFFYMLRIFRTATTCFLLDLAFVHILTTASQEPMYAKCFTMVYLRHPDSLETCTTLLEVGKVIAVAAMNASFLILLVFTIIQYTGVVSPLKYGRCITKWRLFIWALAVDAYSISFSIFLVMDIAEEIVQKIDNIFHSITLVYVMH